MKGLLIAGLFAAASSMRMKTKGYIAPGTTFNTAPSTFYYPQSYGQVSPYYSNQIYAPQAAQVYPQTVGLTQAYPTTTDGMTQVIPTTTTGMTQVMPTTTGTAQVMPLTTGMPQTLQPTTMVYPSNTASAYNPNFLGVQPTMISTPSPYVQPYYTTAGTQYYSPMGPTYYQSNDPSSLASSSFYDYFQ